MGTPMSGSGVSSPAPLPTTAHPTVDLTTQLEEILPNPETFDFVPNLHELLSRLVAHSDNLSQPATYPHQPPLSPQQLQAEVSGIRNMIRRARQAVAALPDVDKSVVQQEEEIAALRTKIERQKRVLQGLGGG